MTPKEKAKELVDRFGNPDSENYTLSLEECKQCALICVDSNIELLRSFEHGLEIDCGNDYFKDDIEELQEVKQEIKQLN